MKTNSVSLSAAGPSAWIPIDRGQNAFGVGFNVDLDSAANLTFKIEHTFDDLGKSVNVSSITRSTTTVTVTVPEQHNLNVGDWVVIEGANVYTLSGGVSTTSDVFDGGFAVASVPSVTTLTYTVTNTGNTTGLPGAGIMLAVRVQPHSTITASTVSVDGNYAFPITALRLNVTSYTAGKATLTVNQGRK